MSYDIIANRVILTSRAYRLLSALSEVVLSQWIFLDKAFIEAFFEPRNTRGNAHSKYPGLNEIHQYTLHSVEEKIFQ
jgi:hypothetical protein